MIRSLQSLRFIFIMLVYMSHFMYNGIKWSDFGGECGVSFFFILSGFVLSIAYGEKIDAQAFRFKPYFLKRFAKIYPLHLLTLLVVLLLESRLHRYPDATTIIPNILLLQSWIPNERFYFGGNSLSWFLSDMLLFYAMFPLLYRVIIRSSRQRLLAVSAIVALLYIGIVSVTPSRLVNAILYVSPALRWIDFSIGILVFRLWKAHSSRVVGIPRRLSPSRATCMELLLLFWLVAIYAIYTQTPFRWRCTSLFWFVIPAVIYGFSLLDEQRGLITRFLHSAPMMWLGGISFEV